MDHIYKLELHYSGYENKKIISLGYFSSEARASLALENWFHNFQKTLNETDFKYSGGKTYLHMVVMTTQEQYDLLINKIRIDKEIFNEEKF